MKYLLSLVLTLLSLSLFAQSDILTANRLYTKVTQVVENSSEDSTHIVSLQRALEIYEKYPNSRQSIAAKSLYAYLIKDEKRAKNALEEAQKIGVNKLDPILISAHITRAEKLLSTQIKEVENILKSIQPTVMIPSRYYFEWSELMAVTQYKLSNLTQMQKINEERKKIFHQNTEKYKKWKASVFYIDTYTAFATHQFEKVILMGEQTLAIYEKTLKQSADRFMEVKLMIIYAKGSLGKSKEAIATADDMVLLLDKEAAKRKSINISNMYTSIGAVYYQMQEYPKAIQATQKSIQTQKDMGMEKSTVMAINYDNLSACYRATGKLPQAKEAIILAINADKNLAHSAYSRLGRILLELKEYDEALEVLQKSLIHDVADFNSENIYDNPSAQASVRRMETVIAILNSKAKIFLEKAKQNPSEKIKLLQAAIATTELEIEKLIQYMEKKGGFEASRLVQDGYMQTTWETLVEAHYLIYEHTENTSDKAAFFNAIERQKAFFLVEALTAEKMPQHLAQERDKLLGNYLFYSQKKEFTTQDSLIFYNQKLMEAGEALTAFKKKIPQQYPDLYQQLQEPNYIKTEEIQAQLLDDQTVFLSYSATFTDIYIYAITKNQKIIKKIPVSQPFYDNTREILALAQNRLLSQKKKSQRLIELSHSLYQDLIAPIAETLKGKSKIVVSPQAEIFYIPFEILLPSSTIKPFTDLEYLVKDFAISYQYSGTTWQHYRKKTPIQDGSFLAFAPVFEKEGSQYASVSRSYDFLQEKNYRSIDGDRFVGLPSSADEIQGIQNLLNKNNRQVALLRKDATKAQLMKYIQNKPYQFIHLATHGLVNYESPLLSGLACYPTQPNKASLYFGGDAQRQSIQADLVVLSSCESGMGSYNNTEGLLSLHRSFIYAGAKNVVFSLWKANDTFTKDLMIEFYKNIIQEKQTYSQALRSAKLKMIANPRTASPRYWSLFILMGE